MIVIYHNPQCSTSRKVLDLIRQNGFEPEVIDYREAGWTRGQLLGLFAAADLTPAQALRTKNTDAEDRGLIGAEAAKILDAMVENPLLVERPLVAGPGGVRLCRPAEAALDVLKRRG